MGVFDTQTNIKKDFTVGDFYEVVINNGGMTGSLEDNAKKVFKPGVTLDDIRGGMESTPIDEFNKLFKYSLRKWIYINGDGFRFNWIGMWRLKRFLRKWVKKEYLSGYNNPYCELQNTRVSLDTDWRRWPWDVVITVYNGEVIESATGACFWFFFKRK